MLVDFLLRAGISNSLRRALEQRKHALAIHLYEGFHKQGAPKQIPIVTMILLKWTPKKDPLHL